MDKVRCADCYLLDPDGLCVFTDEPVKHPRHWRRCEAYQPPPRPSIEATWQSLLDQGLDYFVAEMVDIGHGQRRLRLKAGVDAETRFRVYEAAGLRVHEPSVIKTDGTEAKRQSNACGRSRQGGAAA